MQLTVGVVHVETLAQRVQRIALAGIALARHVQRVLDAADPVAQAAVLRAQHRKLVVEETDVEGRVVDDQLGTVDECEESIGDVREPWFVGEEFEGQAGDFLGAGLEFAIRVDVLLIGAAGGATFHQFHAADFDHAIALLPFEAGGFGIEDDLSHARALSCCL